jgi:hypothetical protein
MRVSLHDTVYGLLNQIVILRDAAYQLIQDSGSDVNTKLRLYSFFSQGDMGDMMIERHRLLMKYVELAGTDYPNQPDKVARAELLSQIHSIDDKLNKWLTFNMHVITMYTTSMIDKIFEDNYDGSLLAVKGFLASVH